jgi:SAM-dependent MidA family methyltransferase
VPRLVAAIRDEILANAEGRITFARFMERVLTEPGLGYYASSELRPTREGDFLTAPELHPLFGRCLGRLIAAAASDATARPYRVLEFGGGRGTLRDTAMTTAGAGVEWRVADLPGRSADPAGPFDLGLANEYLDALPVHRLVQDGGGGLREAWVTWREGWFSEQLGEPSTPELGAYLKAEGVTLRPGQRADVCLAAPAWLVRAAADLSDGGALLVIDYGHEAVELFGPRRTAGSLLTYREHRVADDPFVAVGHTDITSHVDLTALRHAAAAAGLRPIGATTQGSFLARLGLGEMLSALGRQPGLRPSEYLAARAAVARLLDPRQLGGFQVLAWGRPDAAGALPRLLGLGHEP